jgi:hypothetical protein
MQLKGQTIVFENVLIFTAGVAIFIICFTVFNIYQQNFVTTGIDTQLAEIRDTVATHILFISEKDSIDSTITLKIPKVVADEPYEIILSPSGLNVTAGGVGISKFTPLYNLTGVVFRWSTVPSVQGKISIYKTAQQIIIR